MGGGDFPPPVCYALSAALHFFFPAVVRLIDRGLLGTPADPTFTPDMRRTAAEPVFMFNRRTLAEPVFHDGIFFTSFCVYLDHYLCRLLWRSIRSHRTRSSRDTRRTRVGACRTHPQRTVPQGEYAHDAGGAAVDIGHSDHPLSFKISPNIPISFRSAASPNFLFHLDVHI